MVPQAPFRRLVGEKSWGGHPGTRNDFADGRSSQSSPPNASNGVSHCEYSPHAGAPNFVLHAECRRRLSGLVRIASPDRDDLTGKLRAQLRGGVRNARNASQNETQLTATHSLSRAATGDEVRQALSSTTRDGPQSHTPEASRSTKLPVRTCGHFAELSSCVKQLFAEWILRVAQCICATPQNVLRAVVDKP